MDTVIHAAALLKTSAGIAVDGFVDLPVNQWCAAAGAAAARDISKEPLMNFSTLRHAAQSRPLTVVLGSLALGALVTVLCINGNAAAIAQDTKPVDTTGKAAPLNTKDLSLDQAHAALLAAAKKAAEIDTKMDIAVVDAGGNLKAFARMDGAWLGSIDIAIKKAKTARFFDMNTGEIGKLSQPGGPLYNIEHSNGGLITFPGGIPIKAADGTVVGAIGVSGSTVENDHTVAQAGVDALK